MKFPIVLLGLLGVAIVGSGCASHPHQSRHVTHPAHLVAHAKKPPAQRDCFRHQSHWDCKR